MKKRIVILLSGIIMVMLCFSPASVAAAMDTPVQAQPLDEQEHEMQMQKLAADQPGDAKPEDGGETQAAEEPLVVAVEAGEAAAEPTAGYVPEAFFDVAEVLEMEEHISYINGYENGKFKPEAFITRAEASKMFYTLLKIQPEEKIGFPDVKQGSWYSEAVETLAGLGIVKGREGGKFYPESQITRAEFVTMIMNMSSQIQGINIFTDLTVNHWAYDDILSAHRSGWINGYPDGSFRPDKSITRAEAVKLINTVLGRLPDINAATFDSIIRFPDVGKGHWAFLQIAEGANHHEYTYNDDGSERWDVPENDVYSWESSGGSWKFANLTRGGYVSGFKYIDGLVYYFDPASNLIKTGWTEIDGKHYLLPSKGEVLPNLSVNDNLTNVNYNDADRDWQDIEYITVHYTAQPNDTAYQETQAFKNNYMGASAHYFVDERSIWRCVADEDISWHSGTSNTYYHSSARNSSSIGIEMCCKKTNTSDVSNPYDLDWYLLPGTELNTADLVKNLMKTYGVPIENVVRHSDITHKVCPAPYVNDFSKWQAFLGMITGKQISYNGEYEIAINSDNVKIYAGPNTTYSVVGTLNKGDRATVYDEKMTQKSASGRWARIGTNQWVCFPYIERQ